MPKLIRKIIQGEARPVLILFHEEPEPNRAVGVSPINPLPIDIADVTGLNVDEITNALVTIAFPHHETHEGDNYFVRDVIDLPLNNVWDIQITTPNTARWGHAVLDIDVESETEFWVYEGVTINVAGTAITPRNRNRNVADGSVLTVAGIQNTSLANANADTAVAGATPLAHGIVGSGNRTGGMAGSRQEIILKQNTLYAIRFSASTAGYVNYLFDYYEHVSAS